MLNWELLWGVIISHPLSSWGVLRYDELEYYVTSNLCELMFVQLSSAHRGSS